jgi:hypothetical protein
MVLIALVTDHGQVMQGNGIKEAHHSDYQNQALLEETLCKACSDRKDGKRTRQSCDKRGSVCVRFRDAADVGSLCWRYGRQSRTAYRHNMWKEGIGMEIQSEGSGVCPNKLKKSPAYRGEVAFQGGQGRSPSSILYKDQLRLG